MLLLVLLVALNNAAYEVSTHIDSTSAKRLKREPALLGHVPTAVHIQIPTPYLWQVACKERYVWLPDVLGYGVQKVERR